MGIIVGSDVINSIKEIYLRLQDQESRETYLARVNYLITGDESYLTNIAKKYAKWFPAKWIENRPQKVYEEKQIKKKGLIVYGAGDDGNTLLNKYKEIAPYMITEIKYFVDKNPVCQKNGIQEYHVCSPEDMLDHYSGEIICIATSKFEDEVFQWLTTNGIKERDIIFYSQYRDYTCKQYFYNDFTRFEKSEVFIDAGAYDMGTTAEFLQMCPDAKKVYAFEAEKDLYKRCCKNIEYWNIKNAEVFPYALWSQNCELKFLKQAAGSSTVNNEGERMIQGVALDSVVDDQVTFIKMDIEGAELEALKGAEQLIKRNKPKLAICIYHKPEDIWEIPLYICSIVPEYKLYVRHHNTGVLETVLYAMV